MPLAGQATVSGRSAIPAGTRIKWLGFRFLEWLTDLRGNTAVMDSRLDKLAKGAPSIWVFVSTIGELNAIDPLLRRLMSTVSDLKLVLITDHPHYVESYQRRYPDAFIQVSRGHSGDARKLGQRYRPEMLIVGEIPCWPGDAPCRFSFAYVLEAKLLGARACIVNGWLYHYPPSCRMDSLERRLFQRDYLNAFDAIAVQTDDVKCALMEHGASPDRISVVGNLKFDGMLQANWSPLNARSGHMLSELLKSGRPVIVAGCVTEYAHQVQILDAFRSIWLSHKNALLVLAPRHPEVSERMAKLKQILEEYALPFCFRTCIDDVSIADNVACLVLDTIGELCDFYAAATVAHVGVDHNILEPLGFGKPVTVPTGWDETYPSYPVYRLLHEQGGIIEASTPEELAANWLRLLDSAEAYTVAQGDVANVLKTVRGSTERHWQIVAPLLQASLNDE